jgi:hypothetical protein
LQKGLGWYAESGGPLIGYEWVSRNSQVRQLARFREKLDSMESAMGKLRQALESKEKELRKSTLQCSRLMSTVSSLRRDVYRFKARCNRAEGTSSRAVEKAVDRVRRYYESAETKRLKCPDGWIEDWVRDLVVELVALDGVLTTKVPQVINRVQRSFSHQGNNDNGKQTISDRSVRRIMVEAYVKAFMYSAKLFIAAPC